MKFTCVTFSMMLITTVAAQTIDLAHLTDFSHTYKIRPIQPNQKAIIYFLGRMVFGLSS